MSILIAMTVLMSACGTSKRAIDTDLTGDQSAVRATLFQDIDEQLEYLESINADLLSPGNFESGMQFYENAEQLLREQRDIETIRAELARASSAFDKAAETAKLGEVTFSSTITTRNDALEANAPVLRPDNWEEAEATFRTAAIALEEGNVNRARQQSQEAEAQYRSVELMAIQANYLDEARETLSTAAEEGTERTAPKTTARAEELVLQAESLLSQDRYDTSEADKIAREAAYEAKHALSLHRMIRQMQDNNQTFEDALLKTEEPLQNIAEALDLQVRFDEGWTAPTNTIIGAIENNAAREQELSENKARREQELTNQINELNREVSFLRSQIEEKGDLAGQLEIQRMRDEAISSVRGMFTEDEGTVFLDGNNVLIRLYGLSFPVGQSTIVPENFQLLRKVQNAIKGFEDGKIAIEGHTDPSGSLELNMRLSEDRADAVAQYIRANIGMPVNMTAEGFGPERPVASNETAEGRAKNRRIDIVITPEWALNN